MIVLFSSFFMYHSFKGRIGMLARSTACFATIGCHAFIAMYCCSLEFCTPQVKPIFIGITMANPNKIVSSTRMDLANRLFFRLYQCANMLHKTGSRAVEAEGLTTQQWAVLGALSRTEAAGGMSIGDLARYLMVSRQNLAGLISRMERDGHIGTAPDGRDRRSRLVTMTVSGSEVWNLHALPKIHAYYEQALDGFSTNDLTHTLHYFLKLLDNMKRLDGDGESEPPAPV
jgi:DNA-binding MarR family transcriptional regulator